MIASESPDLPPEVSTQINKTYELIKADLHDRVEQKLNNITDRLNTTDIKKEEIDQITNELNEFES